MNKQRIYLSPPRLSDDELAKVMSVLDSGWVAPVGPAIDEFEARLGNNYPAKAVLALNSGTSALHLALILAGVVDGDEVLVSSFTFGACANVILYERAVPIFLDSEELSWNLDPDILEAYLASAQKLPKALIVTHLYGMPAQIERIVSIARKYDVKIIEDAAEALGSAINGQYLGCFGDYGIVSFNGNKIITTSAGGALICPKEDWDRGKHLATQANSGKFGYDHKEAGYNYRMSNVLAGIGLAQLSKLETFIKCKRSIHERYKNQLDKFFDFLEEPHNCFSNRWLTTALIKDKKKRIEDLIEYLDQKNIETRRVWKPLHLHEAYSEASFIGEGICERIFEKGICLPSGSGLSKDQQIFVINEIKSWLAQ